MQGRGRACGEAAANPCKTGASRCTTPPPRAPALRDTLAENMASVLIVDDDGHIREVVRYALTRAGHEVREAKDGAEALREVEALPPDLVVLDILMPEDDGLEVCKRIRKHSRLPIIFLSSRD